MKKILLFLLLFGSTTAFANHLKGGFFTYKYLGPGSNGTLRYQITLTVYMVCNPSSGQLTATIPFTIFDAGTGQIVKNETVGILQQYQLAKAKDEECITGDQKGCYYYIVVYDLSSVELPANAAGYVVSYQRCCRIINIQNISGNSSTLGNTYSIKIPGSAAGQNAPQNSSASFQVNDTVVVCRNSFFQYPFLATDPDAGDSLSYFFCEAWTGGGQGQGSGPGSATPNPAAAPSSFSPLQYPVVPYSSGFSGGSPLGAGVTINPQTGLISGIAPASVGEYVVTVCVNEYKNGVLVAGNRKELHITVGDCGAIRATLDPSYITCDGFNLTFANNTPSGINTYFWDFGVTTLTNDTSTLANPTYPYKDTGTYLVKLVVNRGEACSDSTTALARVFPGFFPGFTHTGVCVNKPTQFRDTTSTRYGFVNTWRWDFGDETVTNDTSRLENPAWTFSTPGTKSVTFIVTNSKGCIDTLVKDIQIMTKPPLSVAFKDTLICNGDSLQLHAMGNGNFSWTPLTTIFNENTADPTVHPSVTTNYFVRLDDQGCIANDTVRVRVVNFVSLQAMADTTICAGDTLRLRVVSDGLRYLWDNAATLNDPTLKNPTARPVNDPTVYTVIARIGPRCFATDDVKVSLTPYSIINAGRDTTICFNTTAQLVGATNGSVIGWSPPTGLSDPASLSPTARPRNTTTYVLSSANNLGCISRDTVTVTVNPEVIAFAGRDTAVVVGQTLQFNGSGGVTYSWSPSVALNNTSIPNPRAVYNGSFDSIRYFLTVADSIGCTDEATVLVKIFRTFPRIFVPTAFTPNGDGRNDFVAPVAVGITKIDYFRIYNRWGQLVFETTVNGKGWDGKISGQLQGTNTFAWIVKGTDYTGKTVFDKGTVTLIR